MNERFELVLEEHQKRVAQGESVENVIASLRNSGMTILDAMKAVKRLYGLTLGDAQRYVLENPAWADEAKKVLTSKDIIEIIAANPLYYAWLEWYQIGVYKLGMIRQVSSRGMEWEREIEVRLADAVSTDGKTQRHLIEDLANHPNETFDALIAVISLYDRHEKPLVELALRAIHAIGYPRNAAAIRWLVFLASNQHAPGKDEAVQTLQDMVSDAVIPYFLAAFVNNGEGNPKWGEVVNGICQIVTENQEWALACGPAVTNLLAKYDGEHENGPDPTLLLTVLEHIIPACTYAIPTLLQLVLREKNNKVGQKAHHLLLSFDEVALKHYQYHMQLLSKS